MLRKDKIPNQTCLPDDFGQEILEKPGNTQERSGEKVEEKAFASFHRFTFNYFLDIRPESKPDPYTILLPRGV